MPVTEQQARQVYADFVREYPSAAELDAIAIDGTIGELYGILDPHHPANTAAAVYIPRTQGSAERGQIAFSLANALDPADLRRSLKHEVIGHHGLNTFRPAEKRAILNGLIASRLDPELDQAWRIVSLRYPGADVTLLAEEVFAFVAEHVRETARVTAERAQRGLTSVDQLLSGARTSLGAADVLELARAVMWGLRNAQRTQQNFPQTIQSLFRTDDAQLDAAVDQAVARNQFDLATGSVNGVDVYGYGRAQIDALMLEKRSKAEMLLSRIDRQLTTIVGELAELEDHPLGFWASRGARAERDAAIGRLRDRQESLEERKGRVELVLSQKGHDKSLLEELAERRFRVLEPDAAHDYQAAIAGAAGDVPARAGGVARGRSEAQDRSASHSQGRAHTRAIAQA